MTYFNPSAYDNIYFTFYPCSEMIPEESRCAYQVSLFVISLLTLGIAPILFYLFSCCLPEPNCRPLSISVTEFETNSPEDVMQRKVSAIVSTDRPAQNFSWQRSLAAKDEKNISFGNFVEEKKTPPPLKEGILQLIGTFNGKEMEMAQITADFMQVSHQTKVLLNDTPFLVKNIEGIRLRKRAEFQTTYYQYSIEDLLGVTQALKQGSNIDMISFTSVDLFTQDPRLSNFVLGVGDFENGIGVYSKKRLDEGNPSQTLRRMMWLASHEYGHMRYLEHCTNFACLMNGGMSVPEIDRNPLTLCSQDAAKVAWMNDITLEEYYTRLLTFYTQFNDNYPIKLDLTQEIHEIEQKLKKLHLN